LEEKMNRVRETRRKLKMRLIDLSKESGISCAWLWHVENDGRASEETKRKVVKALRCPYYQLFPDESENLEEAEGKAL